ncbi:MAG: hypothetical protein LBN04_00310 [Oscillospiraceae bacterium]|jgi:hypothetical protein|nr:hypothetical protein [Oscillospiraceae bacterium]
MRLTRHASQRQKERLGIHNKNAMLRNAAKALLHGISYNDCQGRFRRYLGWVYEQNHASKPLVYNRNVYIFGRDGALVTVFPLPKIYHGAEDKIKARKRREFEARLASGDSMDLPTETHDVPKVGCEAIEESPMLTQPMQRDGRQELAVVWPTNDSDSMDSPTDTDPLRDAATAIIGQ